MRHRRLLTTLSAVSLLLFVAVVVLWVRSYWVSDVISWTFDGYRHTGLRSSMGRLLLADIEGYEREGEPLQRQPGLNFDTGHTITPRELERGFGASRWRSGAAGFVAITGTIGRAARTRGVIVPFWFPAALAALPAAFWLLSYRRHRANRRLHLGLCPSCGYDLRATPDRCPECGMLHAHSRSGSSTVSK